MKMDMDKGEKMDMSDTDSMTTVNVNVKDYGLDYQEAPPAYRHPKSSTTVQVTRTVALAAVIIAAMLSIAIVFSAWISATTVCQQQVQPLQASQSQNIPVLEALLQPEYLKSFLGIGGNAAGTNDLESAESKSLGNNKEGPKQGNNNEQKIGSSSSEEEETSVEADDGPSSGVTTFKLPLELNIQEHMFDRNHRSHMNCVIEKKKAEEIVDEQSKPLPILLGVNVTTDPRYLHFTGEKMAISCDSGNNNNNNNEHRAPPTPAQGQQGHPMMMPTPPGSKPFFPSPRRVQQQQFLPLPLREIINSALAAATSGSVPIHVIGPIPLSSAEQSRDNFQFQRQPHQSPSQIHFLNHLMGGGQPTQREVVQNQFVLPRHQEEEQIVPESSNNLDPLSALGIPPHMMRMLLQQGNNVEIVEDNSSSGGQEPLFLYPEPMDARERGLPHPVPIMPRAHFQHAIRPRRSAEEQVPITKSTSRVKRCACDCACKNHQD